MTAGHPLRQARARTTEGALLDTARLGPQQAFHRRHKTIRPRRSMRPTGPSQLLPIRACPFRLLRTLRDLAYCLRGAIVTLPVVAMFSVRVCPREHAMIMGTANKVVKVFCRPDERDERFCFAGAPEHSISVWPRARKPLLCPPALVLSAAFVGASPRLPGAAVRECFTNLT